MSKVTQAEKILLYLRQHKTATNMELVTALWIACPHKRIAEMTHGSGQVYGSMERITRKTIKTAGGASVTQYRLERL